MEFKSLSKKVVTSQYQAPPSSGGELTYRLEKAVRGEGTLSRDLSVYETGNVLDYEIAVEGVPDIEVTDITATITEAVDTVNNLIYEELDTSDAFIGANVKLYISYKAIRPTSRAGRKIYSDYSQKIREAAKPVIAAGKKLRAVEKKLDKKFTSKKAAKEEIQLLAAERKRLSFEYDSLESILSSLHAERAANTDVINSLIFSVHAFYEGEDDDGQNSFYQLYREQNNIK